MTEPVIFAVERHANREIRAVYRGSLPERLTRKGTNVLVYAVRLDKLPNGDELAAMSTRQLYVMYRMLRRLGALPPSNLSDPPVKTEGRKGAILGEWWEPPARTWDASAPAQPYPDPDAVRRKGGIYVGLG